MNDTLNGESLTYWFSRLEAILNVNVTGDPQAVIDAVERLVTEHAELLAALKLFVELQTGPDLGDVKHALSNARFLVKRVEGGAR